MANVDSFKAPAELNKWRTIALGAGGIGIILWLVGLFFDPEQALRSWLLGFILWAGIGFGSIGILMLQYLTGGAWGVVIRRVAEAATRTIPLLIIMFIPIAAGITYLYEWTHMHDDLVVRSRGWYMTNVGWIARSVVYFAIFAAMAYLLNKWSSQQDRSKDYDEAAGWLGKATAFSGPAIIVWVLVVTFATVDWVMTLEPHWFSTIWGLLFVAGWALSSFSFAVIILAFLSDKVPMDRVLGRRHFHDIGKLMLAFVMVWAYFNFSQFIIIWSGNIPEETGWYITRTSGGWGWIAWGLVIFHFAFPFLVLLQQDLKRRAKLLASVGAFVLLMRVFDMFWLIAPSPRINTHGLEQGAFIVSWMDIVAPIAVGGIWLWYFFGQLLSRPLVPVMDPFLEKAVEHGHGH